MGTHTTRSYDGTSTPRLADFGGEVWMLAQARAHAMDAGWLRAWHSRRSVRRQFIADRDDAANRNARIVARDA